MTEVDWETKYKDLKIKYDEILEKEITPEFIWLNIQAEIGDLVIKSIQDCETNSEFITKLSRGIKTLNEKHHFS